ncbi:MAG: PQQ-binding-like beta-propeller repeat protein, partial [Candidatus Acidiferrales bacterium]
MHLGAHLPGLVQDEPRRSGARHGTEVHALYHDGRIYTLGISGVLSCVDAKSGNPIWSYDSGKHFKQGWPLFGVAMSPGIFDGLLIANLGTNDDGALIAFHSRNGDVKWSWKGDGPGYASPVVVQAGGVKQIITQTQKYVVGVELATGKLLWSLSY